MKDDEPVAFFSYVRSDDEHDSGQISELRRHLEGEVRMQTGKPFHIFQDRNDIKWGQQWKDRIENALLGVTFLVPIITPSFFRSHACNVEFQTFLIREKALGESRLILPVYYVSCDEMDEPASANNDVVTIVKARNWADWRGFRFESLTSSVVRKEIATLATTIKTTMKELETVFAASKNIEQKEPAKPKSTPASSTQPPTQQIPYRSEVAVSRKPRSKRSGTETTVVDDVYYAYTTQFDEIIAPSALSEPADIMRLHSFLLDRVRNESVAFEAEIAMASEQIAEMGKHENLAVSILIDNSGSMRGEKIAATASWTSIIANILASANIPCEVLGYTTRAWKGGKSRELWLRDGKPPNPGRLNDLRHIVYKGFDESFQEADTNFGLMLRDGLLKENIDGEALLWANSRLDARQAERKILLVLSDGAPVDDSTLSVNGGSFLQDHLIATINWIKATQKIELRGVGIEWDVSKFYGTGCPTLSSQQLGRDFLNVVSLAVCNKWDTAGAIQRKNISSKDRRLEKGK